MHKVSSENRTQSIKRVAEQISDSEMIFKVTSEDFADWKCFVSFSVYNTIFA
jgi:hypothetical protein